MTARASISMALSESAAASGTERHPFPPVITTTVPAAAALRVCYLQGSPSVR